MVKGGDQSLGGVGDYGATSIYQIDFFRKIIEKKSPAGRTFLITKCKKTKIDLSGFEYGTLTI